MEVVIPYPTTWVEKWVSTFHFSLVSLNSQFKMVYRDILGNVAVSCDFTIAISYSFWFHILLNPFKYNPLQKNYYSIRLNSIIFLLVQQLWSARTKSGYISVFTLLKLQRQFWDSIACPEKTRMFSWWAIFHFFRN